MDELIEKVGQFLNRIGLTKIPKDINSPSKAGEKYKLLASLRKKSLRLSILYITFPVISMVLLILYSGNTENVPPIVHYARLFIIITLYSFILPASIYTIMLSFYTCRIKKHNIECLSCEHVMGKFEEWKCSRCKNEVKHSSGFKSVLDSCPFCNNIPIALRCPNCHKPIPLGNEDVKSSNWWEHLLSDTYVDISDDIATAQVETSEDKLRKQFNDRLGILDDLHKVKTEFISKAEDIEDSSDRERYLEMIEHIADEIKDKEIW